MCKHRFQSSCLLVYDSRLSESMSSLHQFFETVIQHCLWRLFCSWLLSCGSFQLFNWHWGHTLAARLHLPQCCVCLCYGQSQAHTLPAITFIGTLHLRLSLEHLSWDLCDRWTLLCFGPIASLWTLLMFQLWLVVQFWWHCIYAVYWRASDWRTQ